MINISLAGGIFMDNKADIERYRKLSIASLITGILPYICVLLMWLIFEILSIGAYVDGIIITILFVAVSGLPIVAIVCGSIDFKRIKRGQYSIKGKGFDITGIVLGSVFILAFIWFALADLPIFH
jgi:hypothetical protein